MPTGYPQELDTSIYVLIPFVCLPFVCLIPFVCPNRRWGPLFGYNGHFDVEWLSMPPEQVPPHAKPSREERRE